MIYEESDIKYAQSTNTNSNFAVTSNFQNLCYEK